MHQKPFDRCSFHCWMRGRSWAQIDRRKGAHSCHISWSEYDSGFHTSFHHHKKEFSCRDLDASSCTVQPGRCQHQEVGPRLLCKLHALRCSHSIPETTRQKQVLNTLPQSATRLMMTYRPCKDHFRRFWLHSDCIDQSTASCAAFGRCQKNLHT